MFLDMRYPSVEVAEVAQQSAGGDYCAGHIELGHTSIRVGVVGSVLLLDKLVHTAGAACVVAQGASIDDGIEQVREILPRCVFDEHKCDEGISHLENYRKEWDDKRGCWKDRPLHDHTSHGADAFRYLANSQTKRHKAKRVNISTVY